MRDGNHVAAAVTDVSRHKHQGRRTGCECLTPWHAAAARDLPLYLSQLPCAYASLVGVRTE